MNFAYPRRAAIYAGQAHQAHFFYHGALTGALRRSKFPKILSLSTTVKSSSVCGHVSLNVWLATVRLLLVEDSERLGELLAKSLQLLGYDVDFETTAAGTRKSLNKSSR